MLRARVAAAPVDGAANAALLRLLAAAIGVAPSRLRIVSGESARTKVVEIDDVAPESLRSRWPDLDV